MQRHLVLVVLVFLTFFCFSKEQYVGKVSKTEGSRVALVIGNSSYEAIPTLDNAERDAQLIWASLQDLGFKVIFKSNATKKVFLEKIREWERELKSARVAMFYYVGHGMQFEGVNYIIPIDANIKSENEIKFESIDASVILAKMKEAGCDTNIVVLDACRDKPFGFNTRDTGFAEVKDIPQNCIIVYSTRVGALATDDYYSFSTFFNSHLMNESQMEIKYFLQSVSNRVSDHTNGKQVPITMVTLDHSFYFNENRNREEVIDPPLDIAGNGSEKVKLNLENYTHTPSLVRSSILRRGFFERIWHPSKTFKNDFKELEKKGKRITLIIDQKTDLMWYESGSEPMTHKEAEEWIKQLNNGRSTDFNDWRLPSIEEAVSLLEETGNPKKQILYIDDKFSPQQKRIWTINRASKDKAEDFGDSFNLYWVVDFEYGISARFDGESAISVRPVRPIN